MKSILFIIAGLLLLQTVHSTEEPKTANITATSKVCTNPRSSICTREYRVVCATLADGNKKEYSNGCTACADENVKSWVDGACVAN